MKRRDSRPLRTIGSLRLRRSLLQAAVVDRFRVVVFPVITGATGKERIFDGYPDIALDLIESRTFDDRLQLLEYVPTLLDAPPGVGDWPELTLHRGVRRGWRLTPLPALHKKGPVADRRNPETWTPLRDSSIHLPDGRLLAFAEWGDPKGRPVFLFHGMPGSRLFFPDPVVAAEARVRAITVDRPGMGRSDPQPGHRIADWPRDVLELAEELGLDRFGVIGWSAGSAYAFACAAVIPERLTGAAATTSAASLRYLFDDDPDLRDALLDDDERAILEALSEGRDAAERRAASEAAEWVHGLTEHPEHLAEGADAGDEWFLDDPDRRSSFVGSIRESARQGADAMAPQFVAQVAPWGFRLEDISMPIHVWAGANDAITPPDLMRRVAERIPDHAFTVWGDVGHAGLAKHLDEVFGEL